jgi:predicted CXXCH cytochrome family protein
MCAQCHATADSAEPLATKRVGAALCRGCHNELVGETYSKNRVHWPVVDQRACANCHNPHASANAKLLREPEIQLCGSCHQDAIRRQERSVTAHPPIADGECSTCHAPHASNVTYLLASNQFDLCGTCHDWKGHSAHPLGEEAVDPRNANLTLDCLSCHRTHGSPIEHLAHYDTKRDLCVECHGGFSR